MRFQTISAARKNKTFKVYKHAKGGVLGDKKVDSKVGNHVLLDFIFFRFLLTSNLLILAKLTKT